MCATTCGLRILGRLLPRRVLLPRSSRGSSTRQPRSPCVAEERGGHDAVRPVAVCSAGPRTNVRAGGDRDQPASAVLPRRHLQASSSFCSGIAADGRPTGRRRGAADGALRAEHPAAPHRTEHRSRRAAQRAPRPAHVDPGHFMEKAWRAGVFRKRSTPNKRHHSGPSETVCGCNPSGPVGVSAHAKLVSLRLDGALSEELEDVLVRTHLGRCRRLQRIRHQPGGLHRQA